jgi:hypothetical protein
MKRNDCYTGEPDPTFQKASKAFDALAAATYYGFDFKRILVDCPEALEAAEKLVALVKKHTAVERKRVEG